MELKRIELVENGLYLVFEISDSQDVSLLHFGATPLEESTIKDNQKSGFRPVEIQASGDDRLEYHGRTKKNTMPGVRMRYTQHQIIQNDKGTKLELVLFDEVTGLEATLNYQFYVGVAAVRAWTELVNKGAEQIGIEYVSSFALTGISKEGLQGRDRKMSLWMAHSSWQGEVQWRNYSLPELGLTHLNEFGSKRIAISNTGSWSSAEHIPMGILQNHETGTALYWQIENNGSWHYEIFEQIDQLALLISGPTEHDNHWWKSLRPGESFISVPVAAGAVVGGFDQSIEQLTRYRRQIRRPNADNQSLKIIFNDYMNCLWADPTTAKELPLIDAAAEVGCEYYCIDAGWYAAGFWWDNVGYWQPSLERFPEGIKYVLDYIRSKGMIPGLWLEIEVMGINSPKLAETTDDWFITRHGKKVKDRSRYHLDFRHPKVIEHADEVIDRLVQEYGVGYIKMDYNINAGIGTELNADSFGDGLLQHNRAYLAWLDRVFARYPELVIENCGSGGMRIDYAMLSRHSIQSTSDTVDYRNYAVIAASSPGALTPEQSAIWSYPLTQGDEEGVIFNMVNTMLLRIHQSGHLAQIEPHRRQLVKEALDVYKREIRAHIPQSYAFWPLSLPQRQSEWIAYGLRNAEKTFLAVWRMESHTDVISIPILHLQGRELNVRRIYPAQASENFEWNPNSGLLTVAMGKNYMARLFELC
ncbi:MAG: alpha-galactosidase [Gorillibacterium sp.]|nr:alpha-galactosidase [Gorillibacterium sp.]